GDGTPSRTARAPDRMKGAAPGRWYPYPSRPVKARACAARSWSDPRRAGARVPASGPPHEPDSFPDCRSWGQRLPRNVKVLGLASLLNDIASGMIFPLLPDCLLTVLLGQVVGVILGPRPLDEGPLGGAPARHASLGAQADFPQA